MNDEIFLVYTTVADEEEAEKIASLIIEKNLSPCVQYHPIKSIYVWQGAVEHSNEYVLSIKTSGSKLQELVEFIKSVHSYQVPEIISYKLDFVEENYKEWFNQIVNS